MVLRSADRKWTKPLVLLINNRSYSDAEIFPNAFRTLGLGQLVGEPTGGFVIGTTEVQLIDGSTFRIPRTGVEQIGVDAIIDDPDPARIGTWMSETAEVRVNRGSTWMIVAPRRLASITHWKPTGWASAMLDPSIRMQSALLRSCRKVVAPPRPNEVPRPGTVEECQIRAWFSICTAPIAV